MLYGAFHLEAAYFVQRAPNRQIDPLKKIETIAKIFNKINENCPYPYCLVNAMASKTSAKQLLVQQPLGFL
jgi:hypothetical protein